MNQKVDAVMNQNAANDVTYPPQFSSVQEERDYLKTRLAASCRLFGKFGFDEGLAGHITVRDPEHADRFWVNPMGVSFKLMRQSDLIAVDHSGQVVEGDGLLNGAAFAIHSAIHKRHPNINAVAHAHSLHGKAFSTLGQKLAPLTQDACAFYECHDVFTDYHGVVLDTSEGDAIADMLEHNKALILQNHGLLTVGETIDAATWWYVTLERSCQAQLLAQAAGKPKPIAHQAAISAQQSVGSALAGWFSCLPLYTVIMREQPELFE